MDDYGENVRARRRAAMLAMSKEALADRLDEVEDQWLTASHTNPCEIRVYMDGDSWCAVRAAGFTNIMECACGHGSTPQDAVTELLGQRRPLVSTDERSWLAPEELLLLRVKP